MDFEVLPNADLPDANGGAEDSDAGSELGIACCGREPAKLSNGEAICDDCEGVEMEVLAAGGAELVA